MPKGIYLHKEYQLFKKGHTINLGKKKNKKGIYLTCPECNSIFYVKPSQIKKRKCCSRTCISLSKEWRNDIKKDKLEE